MITLIAGNELDADPARLFEAVGALEAGRSLSPARQTRANLFNTSHSQGSASGYGSANTSQSSTPDHLEFPSVDGGAVVGKARNLFGLPSRKKIKLLQFDKPIPVLTHNRFSDLRELHAHSLNQLTKGLSRCRGTLMSLKVLGEDEARARPWVFIQCDKAIASKVRQFFKRPEIESDYKPPHPDAYTPSFEIYVLPLPPLALRRNMAMANSLSQLYNQDNIEVCCDNGAKSSLGSLCGSKISVSANGQMHSATIGGLISIESQAKELAILGITAGHFLTQESDIEDLEDRGEFADPVDNQGSDQSEDDDFELDLGSFNANASKAPQEHGTQPEMPVQFQSIIGHVLATSQDYLQDGPDFDWALFTIDDISFRLPNRILKHNVTLQKHTNATKRDREVVLMTAMSGTVWGMLSSSWSYIVLTPGRSLVRANALSIQGQKTLRPGDSGAWVVDALTNEVYGHVVASDVFGVAYVIPIDDIFVNIEEYMLAITGKASECKIPEAPSDSEVQQFDFLRLHTPSPLMELDDCLRFGIIEPPILGLIPPKQTKAEKEEMKAAVERHTNKVKEHERRRQKHNEKRDTKHSVFARQTERRARSIALDSVIALQLLISDPIPATTPAPVVQHYNGVQWITFEYSLVGMKMEYTIRCEIDSANVKALSSEFKDENCVYPMASCSKEEYKGKRFFYETECNTVGWALAKLNPCLRGKRGLIQRAVDGWRNNCQDPRLRNRGSRRIANINHSTSTKMQPRAVPESMDLAELNVVMSTPSNSGYSKSSTSMNVGEAQ